MIPISQNTDNPLGEEDMRRMLRLVGEVTTMPAGHVVRKRHFMSALCEMINAVSWVWTLSRWTVGEEQPDCVAWEFGGAGREGSADSPHAMDHPLAARLHAVIDREFFSRKTPLPKRRGADSLQISSDCAVVFLEGKSDGVLLSARGLDRTCVGGMALHRQEGTLPFTARESRIAQIMLSEASWLYDQASPQVRCNNLSRLSPRLNGVLDLLLQGHGRKSISQHLSISANTVSGYVKDIYKHFRVNSHAGLIRQLHTTEGRSVYGI